MLSIIKKVFVIVPLFFFGFLNAQIIDDFGIKFGVGISNEYWDYSGGIAPNLTAWKENKISPIGQVFVEKNIGNYFAISPVIGYVQKGFVDDITFVSANGEDVEIIDNRVLLHDLCLDLSLKFIPIDKKISPYLLAGFRGDYLLDTRGLKASFLDEELEIGKGIYDDYEKFTVGGILGFGVMYKNIVFFDFMYNPSLLSVFESPLVEVKDRFYSLTLGISINGMKNRY